MASRAGLAATAASTAVPIPPPVRQTDAGDITISRSDGIHAVLSRPGNPDSRVALARRDLADLLSEELRRLDPDEVYGEVISHVETA